MYIGAGHPTGMYLSRKTNEKVAPHSPPNLEGAASNQNPTLTEYVGRGGALYWGIEKDVGYKKRRPPSGV